MDFKHKYLKYKNKYLNLINQSSRYSLDMYLSKYGITENFGGAAAVKTHASSFASSSAAEDDDALNIANINEDVVGILEKTLDTNNLGQNNCGIIPYLKYILKCVQYDVYDEINLDKGIREYFPNFYLWPDRKFIKKINEKNFYIMEKLDGDLTKYIIEESYINTYGSLEYELEKFKPFELYYDTLPKTMIKGFFPQENYEKYLSEKTKVILKEIKTEVTSNIIKILALLQPKIIELHHNLVKRNYKYV